MSGSPPTRYTKADWPRIPLFAKTVGTWDENHALWERDPNNARLRLFLRFNAKEKLHRDPILALDAEQVDIERSVGCGQYTIGLITLSPDASNAQQVIEKQWTSVRLNIPASATVAVKRWLLADAAQADLEQDWEEMLRVREFLHGRHIDDLAELSRPFDEIKAEVDALDAEEEEEEERARGGDDDDPNGDDEPPRASSTAPARAPTPPLASATVPPVTTPVTPFDDPFERHYGGGDVAGGRYARGDDSIPYRYARSEPTSDDWPDRSRDRARPRWDDDLADRMRPSDEPPPPPPLRPETIYDPSTQREYLYPAGAPVPLPASRIGNGHWYDSTRGWLPLAPIPAPPPPPPAPPAPAGTTTTPTSGPLGGLQEAFALLTQFTALSRGPAEDPSVIKARIDADARVREKELELQAARLAREAADAQRDQEERDRVERARREEEDRRHRELVSALTGNKADPIDTLRAEFADKLSRFEQTVTDMLRKPSEPPKDTLQSAMAEIDRFAKLAAGLGFKKDSEELQALREKADEGKITQKDIFFQAAPMLEKIAGRLDTYLEQQGAARILDANARATEAERKKLVDAAKAEEEKLQAEAAALREKIRLQEAELGRIRAAQAATSAGIAGPFPQPALPAPAPRADAQGALPFGQPAPPTPERASTDAAALPLLVNGASLNDVPVGALDLEPELPPPPPPAPPPAPPSSAAPVTDDATPSS